MQANTQKQIIDALMKNEAYEENPGKIELIQTHISYVFLTRKFAYKVKKAVNFGFLDFSTLEKRRYFCEKELELNKRLCGDMYIEVVPINKAAVTGTVKIKGQGKAIEYAVKMKRIPQGKIMTRLLEENKVDKQLIDKIARKIVEFHSKAETNQKISEVGALATVKINWEENFKQTTDVINKTISEDDFRLISKNVGEFMDKNKLLFDKRAKEGKVRDCHGDLHSGNIFVADQIYIFDAIEFNERFRYSDVAADMAFLAMDLDFKGRSDLSDFFVEKYVKYSDDAELLKLLAFYKCYRAYVRGKVLGFRPNDPNISNKEKQVAIKEAQKFFKLATSYAEEL